MDFSKAAASVFPIFLYATLSFLHKVHDANNDVYIDEEFHVPQAQRFHQGSTEWDPKITTPPGIYFASLAILKVLGQSSGTFDCSIFLLRLTNAIVTCLNFILVCWIYAKLQRKVHWTDIIEVLGTCLFPVLYFFSFLYYTDVISTFSILAVYLSFLCDRIYLAGLLGLVSLWMRQTNIIWVAFTAALYGYELLSQALEDDKIDIDKMPLLNQLLEGLKRPNLILRLVVKEIPFLAVGVAFAAFLVWNGGIVLGDRSAHQVTVHLAQLMYFSLFCAAFTPTLFVAFVPRFLRLAWENKIVSFLGLGLVVGVVFGNSPAHPYLLADNRHYTFYLWRRLLQPTKMKLILIPVYLFCLVGVWDSLRHRGLFMQLAFAGCVVASLAPQLLLEPRYFVAPFLFFRLHLQKRSPVASAVDLAVALVVNVFTVYVYAKMPFDSGSGVRFIW